MEPSSEEGNLLEIMDLARTLRQEQLFIQQEQAAFARLTETLSENSSDITKLAYICAQQKQNLHDLIISRTESGPMLCCRRAHNYDNAKFIDAKKLLDYEHAIAYEELFNFLYRSPHLLAISLACGDRLSVITPHHLNYIIHIISSALFGNAINSKDVEIILKLLRELIEIQVVTSEQPRRVLRNNASAFARLYNRLNESLFSAKIFLTAALHEPVMAVLSDSDTVLDIDAQKLMQRFSTKERLRRFGEENTTDFKENVQKYHHDSINKLYELAKCFIDSLTAHWSLFPSTLQFLVQTMCHLLKQAHFSDKIVNEVINDMVFTYYICPAIVNPDLSGIIDAPISEQVRYNLMQIGQLIQMLALSRQQEMDMDVRYRQLHGMFQANVVNNLIDLLLVSQSGEDVVAILSQRSEFERSHLLSTQNELVYFVEFFRILVDHEEFNVSKADKEKLKKILTHLPESTAPQTQALLNGYAHDAVAVGDTHAKERSKQSLKSKIAKSMSFSQSGNGNLEVYGTTPPLTNGNNHKATESASQQTASATSTPAGSPRRNMLQESAGNEPILMFQIYNNDNDNKLQPLTEEEVLKMNSIGQQIDSGEALLVDTADSCCHMDNIMDKSSVANGFDGISDDVLRPLHVKTTRFSLSHDDASIGNSDNLEAVSEAPSNHSVTSSLELEEQDQNDNLSDMVSANVSGRGTPNISGRDTPSSQVTDGDSVQLPTPQMQKLISKVRSDIEDKFCKFEIKKFEGDETVSIISDTWSTDVLASDSENVEASERERDRNFSTPLIPSAVVLPGDNNYDVLSGAGAARVGYQQLDVSDQRSESNWSTDVLASDSEKLAEVDTDDNLSVTAKSDITDAGERSDRERNRLAADISAPIEAPVVQQRRSAADVIFYASSRAAAAAVNAVSDAAQQGSGASTGSNASDRSQEDCAFYDAINFYDEANASAAAEDGPVDGANLTSAAGLQQYQLSSLARSSVRTTNQLTGENTFQQNYKSGSSSESKEVTVFLGAPRMRRQASAESSISNQSLNMEDSSVAAAKPPKAHHHHHHHKSALKKKKQHQQQQQRSSNAATDLIDFSDFGLEERNKSSDEIALKQQLNLLNEEAVEHRRISLEQRSAAVDGRRNGILALQSTADNDAPVQRAPSLRRHQSLNYENHEIMINQAVIAPKRLTAMPSLLTALQPQTDDDKLCMKTADLQLHELENDGFNASSSAMLQSKPNKSTGAIPKSISFDASADKSNNGLGTRPLSQRYVRLPDGMRQQAHTAVSNSSIFNKLKHGLLKHRRSHKTTTHKLDEFSPNSRNVSFSANASEVSFDLPSSSSNAAVSAMCNGYGDMTEDILAKYRRKVSTSSEATNSDSIGGGAVGGATATAAAAAAALKQNNNNVTENHAHALHDQAISFNVIKKKIRTVLSKTDLHTGDFRHTTYSNVSPLLTYLRIQLAQAINLHNFQQISYVSEAIRCLSTLEPNQHVQLLQDLQNDLQKRQCYLQYLMRFRQNILLTMENIGQFQTRLRSESNSCNRYLMAVCVRLYVEKRQNIIDAFQEEFAKLNVSDDKIESIEEFIENCMSELLANGGILHGMPEWQVQEARISLERILLQRLYQQVMFPNEDADLSRDTVLSEHIQKLQSIICPSHPALSIPEIYLSEAPWTFAQQQLFYISAYKTPREKLQCVIRCISSIMSLLTMSSGRLPAADDVLPVLIYVVIMANPPYLLSTVEYISCFIGEKLDGEEQFYWTLFGSVVKFIKTMDYLE